MPPTQLGPAGSFAVAVVVGLVFLLLAAEIHHRSMLAEPLPLSRLLGNLFAEVPLLAEAVDALSAVALLELCLRSGGARLRAAVHLLDG